MTLRRGAFGMSDRGSFIESRKGARGWPDRELIFLAGLPGQSLKRVSDSGAGFDLVWGDEPTATAICVQHDGVRVLFGLSTGAIRCYAIDGTLLWNKASVGPTVMIRGGKAWAFNQFDTVTCYDASDGTQLWQTVASPTPGNLAAAWVDDDDNFRFVSSRFDTIAGVENVYVNEIYKFDSTGVLTIDTMATTNDLSSNRRYACRAGDDIILLDLRVHYVPGTRYDSSLIKIQPGGGLVWKNTFATNELSFSTSSEPVLAKNGRIYGNGTSWADDGTGGRTLKSIPLTIGFIESIASASGSDLYYYGNGIARLNFESEAVTWQQAQPAYTAFLARLPIGA